MPGAPGAGGPGFFAPTAQHPKGTQILVLGIVSLVCCGLLGPVAFVMGNNARKEMAANPGVTYTNSTQITVGWILGIIATVFLVLGIIYGVTVGY
jgi:hypothetical protein